MRSVIITPSYAPDFERCKILCKSIEKFGASYDKHIIIVDEKDFNLFSTIKGDKIEILKKESTLPRWLKKIPFSKKWWLSFKTIPVRGWILQQIIKLSVAECTDADMYFFADSDIIFIRPFNLSDYIKDGKVRLYRFPRREQDFQKPRNNMWYKQAGKLFNLPGDDYTKLDFIGPLVTWRRDTLLKLNQYIKEMSGKKSWQQSLCNNLYFSEYVLYGLFCEYVLKNESGHYWDKTEICHTAWSYTITNLDDIHVFLKKIRPEHIAICIQSNLKLDPQVYINYIKELEKK